MNGLNGGTSDPIKGSVNESKAFAQTEPPSSEGILVSGEVVNSNQTSLNDQNDNVKVKSAIEGNDEAPVTKDKQL